MDLYPYPCEWLCIYAFIPHTQSHTHYSRQRADFMFSVCLFGLDVNECQRESGRERLTGARLCFLFPFIFRCEFRLKHGPLSLLDCRLIICEKFCDSQFLSFLLEKLIFSRLNKRWCTRLLVEQLYVSFALKPAFVAMFHFKSKLQDDELMHFVENFPSKLGLKCDVCCRISFKELA